MKGVTTTFLRLKTLFSSFQNPQHLVSIASVVIYNTEMAQIIQLQKELLNTHDQQELFQLEALWCFIKASTHSEKEAWLYRDLQKPCSTLITLKLWEPQCWCSAQLSQLVTKRSCLIKSEQNHNRNLNADVIIQRNCTDVIKFCNICPN